MNMRKKLIIIFGPEAVGKMRVGYELSTKLGYNLVVRDNIEFFVQKQLHGKSMKITDTVEQAIFKGFAQINPKGIVYTRLWNFENSSDRLSINQRIKDCLVMSSNVFYVELAASFETRKFRNTTDFRLKNKQPVSSTFFSEDRLTNLAMHGKYTGDAEEFGRKKNYLYIDTEKLSAAEAAFEIIDKFRLTCD